MNEIRCGYTTDEKLKILSDAAKYDVACTSSGVSRSGKKGFLGNSVSAGICHSFAADGRCISLLKVLLTNHCIYDCKYCINRRSNDVERVAFEPDELCRLVIEFYKRNYIEGLFLSSGVMNSPDYTMERLCEVILLLRVRYRFNGYIHVKAIPGASDELVARLGYLADRMSVNMELPTREGLKKLAPNKTFEKIFDPMTKISDTIAVHRLAIGKNARMERSGINKMLDNSIFSQKKGLDGSSQSMLDNHTDFNALAPQGKEMAELKRAFAPAGQSTQMIIGATDETDLTLIETTQKLYQTYDLKRVFYSAYIPINEDSNLPAIGTAPPLLREHRLYQADWLLRFYGFQARELLSEDRPNFNEKLDPKCDWALRHLDQFPIEVTKASPDLLLRIPGVGPKSASRIITARRYGRLDFDSLKRMGVVLKRAHYFITCNGKMMFKTPIEEQYIERQLIGTESKDNWKIEHQNETYHQMSIFEMMSGLGQQIQV